MLDRSQSAIYAADPAHREILDHGGGRGAIQHFHAFGPGANEVWNAMNIEAIRAYRLTRALTRRREKRPFSRRFPE